MPFLTYGHECWSIFNRILLKMQVAEMWLLWSTSGVTWLNWVCNLATKESLQVKQILLSIESSQLCCYRDLTRISEEGIAKQIRQSKSTGRRRSQPSTRWLDNICSLSWSYLGIQPESVMNVTSDLIVWRRYLGTLFPCSPKSGGQEWMDELLL